MMSDEYGDSPRSFITHHSSLITFLALAAVAAIALANSWNRWLDPIVDVGRDLYIPTDILLGQKLYTDVLYFYPPLTPYLLAAITWLGGGSLLTYTIIGIVVSAGVTWQLWQLGRLLGDRVTGAVAALFFLAFSFAGASTWGSNFIFPYAHAATFGITFVLLFVSSIIAERFALAAVFGLLASFTKIEFAFLVIVTSAIAGVLYPKTRRFIAWGAVAGVTAGAMVWMYFSDAPRGQHWLFDNVLSPALFSGTRSFYREVSGFAAGSENLVALGLSTSIVMMLVFALRLIDAKRRMVAVLFVIVAGGALAFALDHALFRSWAVFQFALLPVAWRERNRPFVILLVVSILTTWRVLLRLTPDWYGFFLLVPAYVAIVYVLLAWLPQRGMYSRGAALLWLPVFALLSVQSLYEQKRMWDLKKFAVNTPRGLFYDFNPDRAVILNDVIDRLKTASSLVVIPEGLTLNYFAEVPNPTPFHTFTPAELDREAENRAIATMLSRPQYVILLTRDVSEFGSAGFGVDYGRGLLNWIQRMYVPIKRYDSPRFSLVLLQKRA